MATRNKNKKKIRKTEPLKGFSQPFKLSLNWKEIFQSKKIGPFHLLLALVIAVLSFFSGAFLNRSLMIVFAKPESPVVFSPNLDLTKNASMWAEPSSVNVDNNNLFDISVFIDAKNQIINGVDAVISFDENMLKVQKITTEANSFLFPRKKAENGKIYLTGIKTESNDIPSTQFVLATLTFKAKTKGKTALAFEFEKGTNRASTIIKADGSENILGQIKNNVSININ